MTENVHFLCFRPHTHTHSFSLARTHALYSRVAKGGRNGGLFTLFSLYISIYLYPNRQHSWPRIHLIDLRSGTKLYSELNLKKKKINHFYHSRTY